MRRSDLNHLLGKVVRTAEGCWVWPGRLMKDGYARTGYQGKKWLVHRLMYSLIVGPIPEGHEVDHLCNNRACCNPYHLEPVTHAENVRRAPDHNGNKTRCKRGHEYTPENTALWTRNGGRTCRACTNDQKREARRFRRAS